MIQQFIIIKKNDQLLNKLNHLDVDGRLKETITRKGSRHRSRKTK